MRMLQKTYAHNNPLITITIKPEAALAASQNLKLPNNRKTKKGAKKTLGRNQPSHFYILHI